MNEPAIEFHIVNEPKLIDGKASVEGRCLQNPINLGQKMNALSQLVPYTTPEGFADATRDFVCEVDLKVISIRTYGKYIPELSPMMSGRLEIDGQGTGKIRRGLALAFIEPELRP